jgi:hypothetical protein
MNKYELYFQAGAGRVDVTASGRRRVGVGDRRSTAMPRKTRAGSAYAVLRRWGEKWGIASASGKSTTRPRRSGLPGE